MGALADTLTAEHAELDLSLLVFINPATWD
jgi:hypothetical protein